MFLVFSVACEERRFPDDSLRCHANHLALTEPSRAAFIHAAKILRARSVEAINKRYRSVDNEFGSITEGLFSERLRRQVEGVSITLAGFMGGQDCVAFHIESFRLSDLHFHECLYSLESQYVWRVIYDLELEAGNEFAVARKNAGQLRIAAYGFNVNPLLHYRFLQPDRVAHGLSRFTRFPRLPADYATSTSRNDNQPPIRVSPPYLGPFDGCVPGWRAATGLFLVIAGGGLAIFAIRRMKGWLLLGSWLLAWVGIFIALTHHYPCTEHPNSKYHPSFQHGGNVPQGVA
jgi:hypothetical protein